MWPALKGVEGCVCLTVYSCELFGGVRVHRLCKPMLSGVRGCTPMPCGRRPGCGVTVCVVAPFVTAARVSVPVSCGDEPGLKRAGRLWG